MKKLISTNAMMTNYTMFTKITCIALLNFSILFNAFSQEVKPIDLKQFETLLNRQKDTIYVYNFFATWCKPCVKEIPHFVKFANDSASTKVKVVFINLDQLENLEDIVNPFVSKKKITQNIYLLSNSNYTLWMPRVDRRWGGSIPATLVINGRNNKRGFIEGEISYKELSSLVNSTK